MSDITSNSEQVQYKKCSKCGEKKTITAFYMDRSKPTGYRSTCKECDKKRVKLWNKNNPEKYKDKLKRYYKGKQENRAKNPERKRELDRLRYAKNIEHERKRKRDSYAKTRGARSSYDRARFLRTRYGLSLEDYDKKLKSQGGVCELCGYMPGKRLHVDHDHATGKIRGLLCYNCNMKLVSIEDSDFLSAALEYLKRYR